MMHRFWTLLAVILVAVGTSAQWSAPRDVPAYNAAPPGKKAKLRPILPASQRTGPSFQYPFQTRSYELAEKMSSVLHQQPCYCYCDRSIGHNSLRSCFETDHGAHCATCMKEVFYAYEMSKKKKTAAQIRAGIIRGEWESIDLARAASTP